MLRKLSGRLMPMALYLAVAFADNAAVATTAESSVCRPVIDHTWLSFIRNQPIAHVCLFELTMTARKHGLMLLSHDVCACFLLLHYFCILHAISC